MAIENNNNTNSITKGAIEYGGNCYVLQIQGAQGQTFFFNPKVPKEQVEALNNLKSYADKNKVEITNLKDYPPLSNTIQLIPEMQVKPLQEGYKIVASEMIDIPDLKSIDELQKMVSDAFSSIGKGFKQDPTISDGLSSTTFNTEPKENEVSAMKDSSFGKVANAVATKGVKDVDLSKSIGIKESDGLGIYDKNSKIFESDGQIKSEYFNTVSSINIVLESKVNSLLDSGLSIGDVVELVSEAIYLMR